MNAPLDESHQYIIKLLPGTGQSIKRLLLVARDLKKRVMDRAGKNDGEFTILKKERSYSHVAAR